MKTVRGFRIFDRLFFFHESAFLPKPGQHKLRSFKMERKSAVKTEAWARKQAHWLPRVASFFENATFSPTRHYNFKFLSSQTSAIRYHCCLQLTRLSRNFKRSSSTRQVWQCWCLGTYRTKQIKQSCEHTYVLVSSLISCSKYGTEGCYSKRRSFFPTNG